jgi:hypothetical protein
MLAIRENELVWLRKTAIARGIVLLLINLNPVLLAGECALPYMFVHPYRPP